MKIDHQAFESCWYPFLREASLGFLISMCYQFDEYFLASVVYDLACEPPCILDGDDEGAEAA